jgi:hypothetical protein
VDPGFRFLPTGTSAPIIADPTSTSPIEQTRPSVQALKLSELGDYLSAEDNNEAVQGEIDFLETSTSIQLAMCCSF